MIMKVNFIKQENIEKLYTFAEMEEGVLHQIVEDGVGYNKLYVVKFNDFVYGIGLRDKITHWAGINSVSFMCRKIPGAKLELTFD